MSLPTLEATICLLRKEDKTLFIDYTSFPHPLHEGYFSPPGGKINPNESKEQSAVRETLEETGIAVKSLVYKGKVFFNNEKRFFGDKPSKYNFIVYYFDSYNFNDSQAKASEGKLVWIANREINDLPMHKGDKKIMKWLENYKEINAEVREESGRLAEARLISFTLYQF